MFLNDFTLQKKKNFRSTWPNAYVDFNGMEYQTKNLLDLSLYIYWQKHALHLNLCLSSDKWWLHWIIIEITNYPFVDAEECCFSLASRSLSLEGNQDSFVGFLLIARHVGMLNINIELFSTRKSKLKFAFCEKMYDGKPIRLKSRTLCTMYKSTLYMLWLEF